MATGGSSSSVGSLTGHKDRPPVSYVLLAEFDIDEGAVLRHEYPHPTGVDSHLLAEHMLPDGAHDRPEDWTIFYLNQIPRLTINYTNTLNDKSTENSSMHSNSKGKGKAVEGDNNGLLYVMTLVRTKKDSSVKRGALIKALAVATHNPYIQIYKPILLLALEQYFSDPSIACLARLYTAINSMDLSSIPKLTLDEKIILRTSERKDLFEEKFFNSSGTEANTRNSAQGDTADHTAASSLRKMDSMKSLAETSETGENSDSIEEMLENGQNSASTSQFNQQLRSNSNTSLNSLASNPIKEFLSTSVSSNTFSADEQSLAQARSRANTLASGIGSEDGNQLRSTMMVQEKTVMPQLTAGGKRKPKDTHSFESSLTFENLNLPIRIPLNNFEEEVGEYSIIKLVQTFTAGQNNTVTGPFHPHLHTSGAATHPIILLFNALITHKRVLFLGYGQPAGDVARLVLAACALGSGCGNVLLGMPQRSFPYTNLLNYDSLEQVAGFVAGVCNPKFADKPTWWDILCNIETGKIIVSKDIQQPNQPIKPLVRATVNNAGESTAVGISPEDPETAKIGLSASARGNDLKQDSYDAIFMEEISAAIAAHYGENVIRARFTDYLQRFIRLASKYEEESAGKRGQFTSIGFPSVSYNFYQSGELGSGFLSASEDSIFRELTSNAGRIEGWRLTPSYAQYQRTFSAQLQENCLRKFDLSFQLNRLRSNRKLPADEIEAIFRTLVQNVKTEPEILAVLAQLPAHYGGLLPLAFGLFHPVSVVRNYTLELFDTIASNPTGEKFFQTLNAFHRSAYSRLSAERATETPSANSVADRQ